MGGRGRFMMSVLLLCVIFLGSGLAKNSVPEPGWGILPLIFPLWADPTHPPPPPTSPNNSIVSDLCILHVCCCLTNALVAWLQGIVNVGGVDMTQHQSVGAPYNVQGFPTIKIFGLDKKKPADYNGGFASWNLHHVVL